MFRFWLLMFTFSYLTLAKIYNILQPNKCSEID